MRPANMPFNITLLKLNPGQLRLLKPITTLDRFESGGSTNFHPDGLFSTEIFGRVGSDERETTFAYIPLKTKILHPVIIKALERLKRLYTGILSRKEYALWDEKIKDFVPADETTGQTGFAFFMKHWEELNPPSGASDIRKMRVELVEKQRDRAVIDNLLVMPAGLRDAVIDEDGRVQEDEINEHYLKLIRISNTIGAGSDANSEVYDTARWAQQSELNKLYALIESLLSGKHGYIQSKFGSRRIMNGTRNVISSVDLAAPDVSSEHYPGPDDTVMGLWQTSRGALEVTLHHLMEMLSVNFGDVEGNVRLIDVESLEAEFVQVAPQTFDRWTTTEGLTRVVSSLSMVGIRAKPVVIEGRYLALVYKPKNRMVFRIFHDIRDLPENLDKNDVYPITYMELIYLCNYAGWKNLRAINTRYPVTGEGSTYPSKVFVRTTVNSDPRVELGADWEPLSEDEHTASVFPNYQPEQYIDTTMVHSFRLAGLGGDRRVS